MAFTRRRASPTCDTGRHALMHLVAEWRPPLAANRASCGFSHSDQPKSGWHCWWRRQFYCGFSQSSSNPARFGPRYCVHRLAQPAAVAAAPRRTPAGAGRDAFDDGGLRAGARQCRYCSVSAGVGDRLPCRTRAGGADDRLWPRSVVCASQILPNHGAHGSPYSPPWL